MGDNTSGRSDTQAAQRQAQARCAVTAGMASAWRGVLSVFWFVGFGVWLRDYDLAEKWEMAGHLHCYTLFDIKREGLSNVQQQRRSYITGDRLAQYEKEDREALAQYDRELKECREQAVQRFQETVSPIWGIVLADAFVLALLWFLAWIVVAIGRWVRAGFQQQA
jgi:hypothetical protein